MVRLQNPSLGQVTFLLNFKAPQRSIRFSQGDAEVAFGAFGAGQSQQTNAPDDAPPTLPRIIFVKDRKNIAISQLAVQFTQGPEPKAKGDLATQFAAVTGELLAFYRQALEYKPESEYSHTAIVVQVNYPSSDPSERLHAFVYEKFIAFQPIGDLASVQLTLGFKINELFVNLGVAVYETRQFEMKDVKPGTAVSPASMLMSMTSGKVIEQGVQFTVDINNRPRYESNGRAQIGSPEELFDIASQIITERLPSIVKD